MNTRFFSATFANSRTLSATFTDFRSLLATQTAQPRALSTIVIVFRFAEGDSNSCSSATLIVFRACALGDFHRLSRVLADCYTLYALVDLDLARMFLHSSDDRRSDSNKIYIMNLYLSSLNVNIKCKPTHLFAEDCRREMG